MAYFDRLRTNPAGYIAMFLGSVAPIPVDMLIAQMSLTQSLATRAWFIVFKTSLGGQYDRLRDILLARYGNRLPKWVIDGLLYSLFQATGYSVALIFVGAKGENVVRTLSFVLTACFFIGPAFGLALDWIKKAIENLKRRYSRLPK